MSELAPAGTHLATNYCGYNCCLIYRAALFKCFLSSTVLGPGLLNKSYNVLVAFSFSVFVYLCLPLSCNKLKYDICCRKFKGKPVGIRETSG